MAQSFFIPGDLAGGDAKSAAFDFETVDVVRLTSATDPLFEFAYQKLWDQFGAAHELESRAVLARRFAWDSASPNPRFSMRYDLVLIRDKTGAFVAARDHSAVADASGAVVHLSHVLVAPQWRRSGLAGWLRTLPIQTARECLIRGGFSPDLPITLAAEMEYADGVEELRSIRLRAYQRAGYVKVDPAAIHYRQPDFRTPPEIDAAGGAVPLRFQLIVRRIGREEEASISGAEVRSIVERFYAVYGPECRPADIAPLWEDLAAYPGAEAQIALIPPTA